MNITDSTLLHHNETVTLQAVLRHRLTARLLARLSWEKTTWATSQFVAALVNQQEIIERGVQARLTELQRLSSIVAELRPAIIKGPTAYLITGDARCLRFSNDIDLLTDNPGELTNRLISAGYRLSDDYCRPHEFSSLYHDEMNIDVHRYFPVIGASSQAPARLKPEQNSGLWSGLQASKQYQITYQMILEDSSPLAEASGLLHVGPTMGYLIACTHIFREYHDSHALLPYATIRLGELCEALEMRRHPRFTTRLYDRMVAESHSAYSLDFIKHLIRGIFKSSTSPETPFTHDAWLPGFVVLDNRASNLSDLLIRSAPPDQFITDLGMADVRLNERGESPLLELSRTAKDQTINRLLVHGKPRPISTQFVKAPHALHIIVRFDIQQHAQATVLICVGDYLYEVTVQPHQSASLHKQAPECSTTEITCWHN